jgi:hypothetical protein
MAEKRNHEELLEILKTKQDLLEKNKKGLISIFGDSVGISYKLYDDKIRVCLRLFSIDYLCRELSSTNPSAELNVDLFFLTTKLSLYLEGACIKWQIELEIDKKPTWTDGGSLMCFGPTRYIK